MKKRKKILMLIVMTIIYFFLSISYDDLFNGNFYHIRKSIFQIISNEILPMIFTFYLIKIIYKNRGKKFFILYLKIEGWLIFCLTITAILYIISQKNDFSITYNDIIFRLILLVAIIIEIFAYRKCKRNEQKNNIE